MMNLTLSCLYLLPGLLSLTPVAEVSAPFTQDTATHYTPAKGLPAAEVHAIALDATGAPIAATAAGLARFDEDAWHVMEKPGFNVEHLCAAGDTVYAAGGKTVARHTQNGWKTLDVSVPAAVATLAPWDDGIALAAGTRLLREDGAVFARLPDKAAPVRALAWAPLPRKAAGKLGISGTVAGFVGADSGLYAVYPEADAPRIVPVYPADKRYSWAPREVHALAGGSGWLWFGAENGAGLFHEDGWTLYTGAEGLPYNRFTGAAASGPNTIWFGTKRGTLRHDGAGWHYRAAPRWLPDNTVNAIAAGPAGGAWVATGGGIAHLDSVETTLAEKAAHYEALIDKYHWRDGLIGQAKLAEPGNLDTAKPRVSNNQGGRTTRYGAAEAFRYAATGDPEAKKRAKEVFEGLRFLVDVTGIPGFPARTAVKARPGFNPNPKDLKAKNRKRQQDNPWWKNVQHYRKSPDGEWWWRCDTSSDELVGHFFFLDAYHAFVAETDEEKAACAALTREMADHLVDNGFRLVDYDGRATRWGNYSPDFLGQFGAWPERGLYAAEMLAFLAVAENVTGDAKFADAADMLCHEHDYHIHARRGRTLWPPYHAARQDINHAMISYYLLLRHEQDAERIACYQAGLDRTWLWLRDHNDPFFNVVYAAIKKPLDFPYYGDPGPFVNLRGMLEDAAQSLREIPRYLLEWKMKNSHRLDVRRHPLPGMSLLGLGWGHDGEALPIGERGQTYFKGSNLELDSGKGGDRLWPGIWYLLPYYMGVYYQFWSE